MSQKEYTNYIGERTKKNLSNQRYNEKSAGGSRSASKKRGAKVSKQKQRWVKPKN